MPLFPPLSQVPWALLPDDRDNYTSPTFTLSANNTYISNATFNASGLLTGFRFRTPTGGNGNYDVGLYDVNGNLLCHTGVTATSSNIITAPLAKPFALAPGRYYIAFWIDNATDQVRGNPNNSNGTSLSSNGNTGAGGLAASITAPLGTLGTSVDVIGLLQGGWS